MFATQKSKPVVVEETKSQTTTELLSEIQASEPGSTMLLEQINKIINIFQFLETKEDILKPHTSVVYELKKLQNTVLPQLLQKYKMLPVDYRQSEAIKEEQTAQQILMSQLKNIEYVLVDMINIVLAQDKKDFLVEAQYVENKASTTQKEELSEDTLKVINTSVKNINAEKDIAQTLNQTNKNLENSFVFYEKVDTNNITIGQNNKKLVLGVILVVAVFIGIGLLLL